MIGLLLPVAGYFFLALAQVGDKIFLSLTGELGAPKRAPLFYAMSSGLLGVLALPIIFFRKPFNAILGILDIKMFGAIIIPQFDFILFSFLIGLFAFLSLYFLYRSFKMSDPVRASPVVGVSLPLFTLLLNFIFAGERLSMMAFAGVFVLLTGIMMVAYTRKDGKLTFFTGFGSAVVAGFFFALTAVGFQLLFSFLPFISGLIWAALGSFLLSVLLLFNKKNRQLFHEIIQEARLQGRRISLWGLFTLIKIGGLLGGFLNRFALTFLSATIVNALSGFQYAFIFLLSLLLVGRFPQLLKEGVNVFTLARKALGVVLVGAGFVLLVL